jgi:uncharacterized RDD family membrane protein YckC
MVYCPKCGSQNPDQAKFCNNCASPLETTAAQAPQEPPQGQAPLPPQLQPDQKGTLLDYMSHYTGLQYHWVRRFVALVLDSIFVVVPVYVVLSIMAWLIGGWVIFGGILGIFLFLYSAVFEAAVGATVGKSILGLKVVSTKGKLDFGDTLIRNVTKVYPLLLLIEFIVSLFLETKDAHQRFMDKVARTTVVERTT